MTGLALLAQDPVPIPPTPPTPESLSLSFGMDLGEFLLVVLALLLAGAVLVPLVRAIARRIEGRPSSAAELEELRTRLHEVELQAARVPELEERLDFAERLLAQQQREAGRLEP